MHCNNKKYKKIGGLEPVRKKRRKLKKIKTLKATMALMLLMVITISGTQGIIQAFNLFNGHHYDYEDAANNSAGNNNEAVNNNEYETIMPEIATPETIIPDDYTGYQETDNSISSYYPEGGGLEQMTGPVIIYDPANPDIEQLAADLHHFQNPLPGSVLSWNDAHMPNAPRQYRNGYHQGLDFYPEGSGNFITTGTPVRAVAPGKIIRIDHHYEPLSMKDHRRLSALCQEKEITPEYILDIFRGRQVWIDHGIGIISKYAHLHEVASELQKGDYITGGREIGTVGATGTSSPERPHLHLEVWIGDYYLGEGMSVAQVRDIMQKIFFE